MRNKCLKCGNEIKEGYHVCTHCGTKTTSSVEEYQKEKEKEKKEKGGENHPYFGVGVAGIAALGVLFLFRISAPLGFVIYLVAFTLSLKEVKKDFESSDQSEGIWKFGLSYIKKEKFLSKGIYILIIAALPVMAIIGIERWLFADTERVTNYIFERFS